METTHRSLYTTSSSNKITVPFYAPPRGCKKTSAEIISEARAAMTHEYATNQSIRSSRMAARIRPVNTKRPFTPQERERTLFGGSKKFTCRPPSSFSLDCLLFQEPDHTPITSPHMKKPNPLTFCSSLPSDIDASSSSADFVMWKNWFRNNSAALRLSYYAPPMSASSTAASKFRLPSIQWDAKHQSKSRQLSTTGSLRNLPEEIEDENGAFEYDNHQELPPPRKAYSSPTQRTQNVFDGEFNANVSVVQEPTTAKKLHQNVKFKNQVYPCVNSSQEKHSDNCNELFIIKSKLPKIQKQIHIKEEPSLKENIGKLVFNKEETPCIENSSFSAECLDEYSQRITSGSNSDDKVIPHSQMYVEMSSLSKVKDVYRDHKHLEEKEKLSISTISLTEDSDIFLKSAVVDKGCSNIQVKKSVNKKVNQMGLVLNKSNTASEKGETLSPEPKMVQDEKETFQTILRAVTSLLDNEEKERESLLIQMLKRLFICLESEGVIGSKVCNRKVKPQVLKVLYKLVESSSDLVVLEVARIMLALRVTGSNLTGVCKLIFKVSRNDKNDTYFLSGNILEMFVEALGSASPLDDAEACVYGYGALKFLTMNNVLLEKVIHLGILELMVLHMKIINASRQESASIPEQTNHALFQLTGALRNVAGEENMLLNFIETGTVAELCTSLDLFSSDLDVVSNISRTFSVISAQDECCAAIVNQDHIFKVFVKLILKYPGHQDIIVRLGYTLGNLMAKSDAARRKFFSEEGAMNSLLGLLIIYLEKDQEMVDSPKGPSNNAQHNAGSSGSVEDVIIKTVRIIANMSINAIVGNKLAWDFKCNMSMKSGSSSVKEDGQLLDILLSLLRRKSIQDSEELVHSILSTLNNLSYYPCNSTSSLSDRKLEIAQVLYSLLRTTNLECLIEATRICGNLTRSKDVRDFIFQSGGMERLLTFLESSDHELLCTTVGVIINMMADWDKRLAFRQENGIRKMIDALGKHGEDEWLLATFICQALWNYSIDAVDLYSAFTADELNELLELLADFLDEERLFGIKEGCEANESVKTMVRFQAWEDFSGVATDLLERLEAFLDSLQPQVLT
ncbi:armadillo repeat-containing protein 2 isoform X2 [Bacillus rossius redtenbacheri]|uniref:armadillo repeat-containing protein 2 isoform X2 n=1 Tax=Bacillus rossius redtenbacheri TaxID=93214 RepID=UPI002FDD60A3